MKKSKHTARVADRLHLTRRQTEAVVNVLLTCITEALREGDKVELRGFGSFRARRRDAREGRNPRTGDAVRVASRKVPFFKAGKNLREKVGPVEPVNDQPVTGVGAHCGVSGGNERHSVSFPVTTPLALGPVSRRTMPLVSVPQRMRPSEARWAVSR